MSFLSVLKAVGHYAKKALDVTLPVAASAGKIAVMIYAPGLSPMFNKTVDAVVQAEADSIAAGKVKDGKAKSAAVISAIGPVIEQGLVDAGLDGNAAQVQQYIDTVVFLLKTIPAASVATPTTESASKFTTVVK
jgi:hypothetical protein